MIELELAVSLETAFRKFGYDIPFDSDAIRNRPGETIIKGLCFLRTAGIINDNELTEHKENYKLWGNMLLRDVLGEPGGEDQINALQAVLKYWHERNSKK